MKTFFITLAIFFICLLQGLMSTKVNSESENTITDKSKHYVGCGYRGNRPCGRGHHYHGGRGYYGWPYGFGHGGCYRNCHRHGVCC